MLGEVEIKSSGWVLKYNVVECFSWMSLRMGFL